MPVRFGFSVPVFAGAADSHPRGPLRMMAQSKQMPAKARHPDSIGR